MQYHPGAGWLRDNGHDRGCIKSTPTTGCLSVVTSADFEASSCDPA